MKRRTENLLIGGAITLGTGIILHGCKRIIDACFKKKEDKNSEDAKTRGYKERLDAKYQAMKDYEDYKENKRRQMEEQNAEENLSDMYAKHPLRAINEEVPMIQQLGERENVETPELLGKWLHAGEIAIVLGRSNIGKSFLLGQMAVEIAKQGEQVYFYDIENMGNTFDSRYRSISSQSYSKNLHNVSPISTLDNLLESICHEMESHQENMTVFVDNITAVAPYNDTQRQLMDELRYIRDNVREEYGKLITFVLAAHPAKSNSDKLTEIWDISSISVRGDGTQVSLADKVLCLDTTNIGAGILRLALPKTRTSKVTEEVSIIQLVDATDEIPYIHFEHICYMRDKDTIKTNAKLPIVKSVDSAESGEEQESVGPKRSGRAAWQPTPEDIDKICKMREENLSWDNIGKAFGVDRKTVQKYCNLRKMADTPNAA